MFYSVGMASLPKPNAALRKQYQEELMISAIKTLKAELSAVNLSIAETSMKLDKLHLKLKKRRLA